MEELLCKEPPNEWTEQTYGAVNYYSALESSEGNKNVNHSNNPADLCSINTPFSKSEGM